MVQQSIEYNPEQEALELIEKIIQGDLAAIAQLSTNPSIHGLHLTHYGYSYTLMSYIFAKAAPIRAIYEMIATNSDGSYVYPSFVSTLHMYDNQFLIHLAKASLFHIIKKLLTITPDGLYQYPDVVENLHARENEFLIICLRNKRDDYIADLLKPPDDVILYPELIDNLHLSGARVARAAAKFRHENIVRIFLEYNDDKPRFPEVLQNLPSNNFEILQTCHVSGMDLLLYEIYVALQRMEVTIPARTYQRFAYAISKGQEIYERGLSGKRPKLSF